ncbi:MAG: hypothetical protein J3K34DRAFT_524733 [Monoraphidium minutum]|nr:MAG: hypothetical protein J3K34DRAFT_524733 [Monoraphidium minutum]
MQQNIEEAAATAPPPPPPPPPAGARLTSDGVLKRAPLFRRSAAETRADLELRRKRIKSCLAALLLVCIAVVCTVAVCFSRDDRCLGGRDVYRAAAPLPPPAPPAPRPPAGSLPALTLAPAAAAAAAAAPGAPPAEGEDVVRFVPTPDAGAEQLPPEAPPAALADPGPQAAAPPLDPGAAAVSSAGADAAPGTGAAGAAAGAPASPRPPLAAWARLAAARWRPAALVLLALVAGAAALWGGGPAARREAAWVRRQLAVQSALAAPLNLGAPACPVRYERHSLAAVAKGAAAPWLFDGAYRHPSRFCTNCRRGGLFSDWCGRRPTGVRNGWDLAQCRPEQVAAVVTAAAGRDDISSALTMTPCDLFERIRGRTLWVIGDVSGALTMTLCDLFERVRGRTLWVIGDSQSRSLARALKCFLIELWPDLQQYTITTNFTAMAILGALPHSGTTYGGPGCVHLAHGTRVCMVTAVQGDLLVNASRTAAPVLPLLQDHLAQPDDIFVINYGLWHPDHSKAAYSDNLRELGAYYKKTKARFPHMFFMETPKQHFETPTGDFQSWWLKERGKKLENFTCSPIANVTAGRDGSLAAAPGDAAAAEVARGTWRNAAARGALQHGAGMRLVEVYNLSVPFWDAHSHNSMGLECSHYCYPSVQHLWIYALYKALKDAGIDGPPKALFPHAGARPAAPAAAVAAAAARERKQQRGCAVQLEVIEQETKPAVGRVRPAAEVILEEAAARVAALRARHGALWWLWARRELAH